MKHVSEARSKRPASSLTNRIYNQSSVTTISQKETFSSKKEPAGQGKKMEDLKIMYKKLTAKALSFNLERGNQDDFERDLRRLASSAVANNNLTELILIDLYTAVFEGRRSINSVKNFLLNINKCLTKIEKIGINFEINLDDVDKVLLDKIVFKECKSLINDVFSGEKTFRNPLPPIFDSFESFLQALTGKEHLQAFLYFLTILYLTRKQQQKIRDNYITLFKQKSSVYEHTTIDQKVNSISTSSEGDEFCMAMKDIVMRIENTVTIKGDDKIYLKSKLKSLDILSLQNSGSSSPRRKHQSNLSAKKCKKNDSNYHKYIKNLKSIRVRETLTPTPVLKEKEKTKSSKKSFDLKISKAPSSKPKLILEREDSSSTNPLSQSNAISIGNKKTTSSAIKIIDCDSGTSSSSKAGQDSQNWKSSGLERMTTVMSRIESHLTEMSINLKDFGDQIDSLKDFLYEH